MILKTLICTKQDPWEFAVCKASSMCEMQLRRLEHVWSMVRPSPAASQPLVKELWLGLGHLPCNARATGIEMANPFLPHAWRLPGKTVQKPEASAVQKGAKKKKKRQWRSIEQVCEVKISNSYRSLLTPVAKTDICHYLSLYISCRFFSGYYIHSV